MGDQREVPTPGEDTGMRGHDRGRGQSRVAQKEAEKQTQRDAAEVAKAEAEKKAKRKWKVKPIASGGKDEAGRPLRTESIKESFEHIAYILAEALGLGRGTGTVTQRAFRASKLDTEKTYKLRRRANATNDPVDVRRADDHENAAKGRATKLAKYPSSPAGRADAHRDERDKKKAEAHRDERDKKK